MGRKDDFSELAQAIVDKTMTKEELLNRVKQDFSMIPLLLSGVDSSKPAVRYGCAKVLMDLSEEHPEKLYFCCSCLQKRIQTSEHFNYIMHKNVREESQDENRPTS